MGERTLREAAEELGCAPQTLSKWLRHEREIGDRQVEQWSAVTGVSRRAFLEGRYASRSLVAELGIEAA